MIARADEPPSATRPPLGVWLDGARHVHHGRVGAMRRVRLPREREDPDRHPVSVTALGPGRGWFGEAAGG